MDIQHTFGEIVSTLHVALDGVVDKLRNGDPMTIALVFAVVALLLFLFSASRMRSGGEEVSNFERAGNIMGRIEKIEMTLNEFKTQSLRSAELSKADFGFIKQELNEIKGILASARGGSGGSSGGGGGGKDIRSKETSDKRLVQPQHPSELMLSPEIEESVEPVSVHTGLKKTRQTFFQKLSGLFTSKPKFDESMIDQLEETLVLSDLGIRTAQSLINSVREDLSKSGDIDKPRLFASLKAKILNVLNDSSDPRAFDPKRREDGAQVVMIVGVNGAGKTTTAAKLAGLWKAQGAKVMLVAADTFRAAAVEQLSTWGSRLGVEVVIGAENAKPASVVFDAMRRANSEDFDVVIVDTAGRLHTKANLMQELEGIRNVMQKHQASAPHETLLVLDGTTGQNAINQAQEFNEATKLTGIVVTKLDGTPKGGVVVAIKQALGIPLRFIGVGEKSGDLKPFNAEEFVNAMLDENEAQNIKSAGIINGKTMHPERGQFSSSFLM